MMKQSKLFTFIFLLVVTCLSFPLSTHADDLVDQSSNIFKFQQKLAMNGNVHAQYKLASMYETGDGVTASIEQAKHWYGRAAEAGSKPAMHRNTYLITREQGYDPAKNADWLNSVKSDANAHNAEAMFLLGQLYKEGLGVKKDLMKSLELLKQVRILGVANVDTQIAIIEDEIKAINKKELQQRKNREQEVARVKQVNEAQLVDKQAENKQQKARDKAEAEALAQVEKIRRYEEAMMKLKQEQRLIDEQQAWAAGGDAAGADDEI